MGTLLLTLLSTFLGDAGLRPSGAFLRTQVVWSGLASLRSTEPSFARMSPSQLRVFLASQWRDRPDFAGRFAKVTEAFLGMPYVLSPLGEGRAPDPDPIFSLAGTDCTTFIEEALALALARSFPEALDWLRRIRYLDGQMDYRRRKHFPEAQWLPDNQRIGLFSDITAAVGGGDAEIVSKRLGPEVYRARNRADPWPMLAEDEVPKGFFSLPVLPLPRALKHLRAIPHLTLLTVVRADLPDRPTRVSHHGLVVVKGGMPFFRHASKSRGRVVDEPLESYLWKSSQARRWPVTGINLQRVSSP